MQDFTKLIVWQKAHLLVLGVYKAVKKFPASERFGLVAQLQRAAASICANIAEGCGRGGDLDCGRFLHYAKGSANEIHYYLILAGDLGFLPPSEQEVLAKQCDEVEKMLASLIGKLRPRTRQLPATS